LLALTVVLGHLTQPIFQNTWPDMTNHAVLAVGGFFVLSGYTIRALSLRSPSFHAGEFLSERLSRLLSVSVPALLLTIVADMLSAWLAPDFYRSHFGGQLDSPWTRIAVNLLMVSQLSSNDLSPFSNSPFWSLSYEAGFYAIWACLMHWRRAHGSVLWLVGALLFFGVHIGIMLPFWLAGAVLFDILRAPARKRMMCAAMIVVLALLVGACLASSWFNAHGVTVEGLAALGNRAIDWFFRHVGVPPVRVSLSIMVAALGTAVFLVPALVVGDLVSEAFATPASVTKVSRKLGALTFPLYLLHFPLLVLARAAQLYDPQSDIQKLLLLLMLIAVAALYEPLGERCKLWLRSQFKALLSHWRLTVGLQG
jgi:peptidoglycan/LPS O-acetylase OafA/YrhL